MTEVAYVTEVPQDGKTPSKQAMGLNIRKGGVRLWMRQFFLFVGPGFLMAIAFLDPGNIAADVNQAVASGYQLMWVNCLGTILAWFIQSSCARMGVLSGSHLASLIREHYPRPASWFLFFCITAAILATDMLEVVGGAIAIHGISDQRIPLWGGVLLTCFVTFVVLSLKWVGNRSLEYIMFTLVIMLALMMCILCGKGSVDIPQMFLGMVWPRLPSAQLSTVIGSLGAMIMPHNLFLHSALMSSREEEIVVVGMNRALIFVILEAAMSLLISLTINLICIVVFALGAQKYNNGSDLGLATIGDILAGEFGSSYRYVWYLGLLASSQASTLTTTFTAQFVITGFLNISEDSVWSMFVTRGVTLVPSVIIAIFAYRIHDGFAAMTNALNTVDSVTVPFAIQPVIALSTFTLEFWRMGRFATFILVLTWLSSWIIIGLNVYNMVDAGKTSIPQTRGIQVCFYISVALYIILLLFFCFSPAQMHRFFAWSSAKWRRWRGLPAVESIDQFEIDETSPQKGKGEKGTKGRGGKNAAAVDGREEEEDDADNEGRDDGKGVANLNGATVINPLMEFGSYAPPPAPTHPHPHHMKGVNSGAGSAPPPSSRNAVEPPMSSAEHATPSGEPFEVPKKESVFSMRFWGRGRQDSSS